METSSPKRRRRHSSRPQSKPTVPRQAAQKKIEESKIHLSSQYDNLDLEKIMDSQYPALQLVPLSSVTNGVIDRTNLAVEEYITPVLGTLTVHGVTENKPDPDITNLENSASTEDITNLENSASTEEPSSFTEAVSVPQSTPPMTNEATKPIAQINEHPLSSPVSSNLDGGNGVMNDLMQSTPPSTPKRNNFNSDERHGITNKVSVEPDKGAIQEATVQADEARHNVLNGITTTSETGVLNADNIVGINGVTYNSITKATEGSKEGPNDVNGIPENTTQMVNNEENETLPDLVLTNNMAVNEANTTEDEDEVTEALLQLSKSDTIPDEESELPLGVLPVDAAPVPITLGNQDVLDVIENFKQSNNGTGVTNKSQTVRMSRLIRKMKTKIIKQRIITK